MYQHKYLQSSTGHLFLIKPYWLTFVFYGILAETNNYHGTFSEMLLLSVCLSREETWLTGMDRLRYRAESLLSPVGGLLWCPCSLAPSRPLVEGSTRPGVVAVVGQAFCPTARAHPVAVRGAGAVILTVVVVVDLVVVIVGGDRAAVAHADGVRSEQRRGRFPRAVGFAIWFVQVTQRAG